MMDKEEICMEDTETFLKYEYKFEHKDMNNNDTSFKMAENKVTFNGLTKEQVMEFGKDPAWIRIRWAFFFLFWIVWVGMLVSAVLVVVFTPSCPFRPKMNWWEKEVVYQIEIENFKDSNDDGTGDLAGLIEKIDYFDEIGVKTILLNDKLLDDSSPKKINSRFGDENSMKELRKKLDDRDMHVIIDVTQDVLEKNSDILTHWLNKYVDGVRVTKADLSVIKNNASEWINQVNQVAKSTFKSKFITFYPFESANNTFEPSTSIDRKLINLKKETDFVKNIENLQGGSFAMGDFESTSKRISDMIEGENKNLLKIYQSLIFLLKGTPFLLYGDELEFKTTDKIMKWDKTTNCGFSKNETVINTDCDKNIKLQKAAGAGKTLTRLYKSMAELRKEPAFQWGHIHFPQKEEDLIVFIREAKGFDSYIIAANTGKETKNLDFKHLFNLKNDKGNVSYFFSLSNNNHEFPVDQEISLDNILLKFGEFLVVKFTKN